MRTCTNCGNKMVEGYLLEEMGETFCSNFCLDIAYPGSSIEMANMTDEQLEDSTWYWTSWEEDDTDEDEDEDEDESSSMEVSYEDIVRASEGRAPKPWGRYAEEHDLPHFDAEVDEDEGALQQVSFEDAKAAFTDDQQVYLVSQVFYKQATHLDDIINHFNFDGLFLIRQDYANDYNMGR